jgi:hypothetical protein
LKVTLIYIFEQIENANENQPELHVYVSKAKSKSPPDDTRLPSASSLIEPDQISVNDLLFANLQRAGFFYSSKRDFRSLGNSQLDPETSEVWSLSRKSYDNHLD